ncbi:MAG: SDR family NAD(P)-dependent oxidoreductase, partial [Lentisphaerae bacterium]|nr:SDR family NAD(P)-dependent oxidoreductase [Lentisphaerota bacterium]
MKNNPSAKINELFSLSGKVAAITGAGGVLFGAVARGLAALGVKVAALDLRLNEASQTANDITAEGGEALAAEIDVLKPESVTRAKDAVLA